MVQRLSLRNFSGPEDLEIVAVGDVHGRADLLDATLDGIAALPVAADRRRHLVFLGDLIDRGPESLRCLDLAMGASARLGHEVTCLMGNHEQMLGIVLDTAKPMARRQSMAALWYANGGRSVLDELASQGHDVGVGRPDSILAALGPSRTAFVLGTKPSFQPVGGDLLFVHAGVSPYRGVDEFLEEEWDTLGLPGFSESRHWAWIRRPFLEHKPSDEGKRGHDGRFVVHGHTPGDGLHTSLVDQVSRDRLNLDTHAVARGSLRWARFVGPKVEIYDSVVA